MSHSYVDAQIRAHADEITGYGYCSQKAVDATERLYKTFTQPGLNAALSRYAPGRVVIKIAEMHGIK